MSDKYEVRIAAVRGMDDTGGVLLAFVRLGADGDVNLCWLPELFKGSLIPELKAALIEKLRFHADMLESGETESRMAAFANVNNPGNRSDREQ